MDSRTLEDMLDNYAQSVLNEHSGKTIQYITPASSYGEIPKELPFGVAAFTPQEGLNYLLGIWKKFTIDFGFLRPADKQLPPDDLFLPYSTVHGDIAKWGYLVIQEATRRKVFTGAHRAQFDGTSDGINEFAWGPPNKAHFTIKSFSENTITKLVLFEWYNANNNHVGSLDIAELLDHPDCITWRVPYTP